MKNRLPKLVLLLLSGGAMLSSQAALVTVGGDGAMSSAPVGFGSSSFNVNGLLINTISHTGGFGTASLSQSGPNSGNLYDAESSSAPNAPTVGGVGASPASWIYTTNPNPFGGGAQQAAEGSTIGSDNWVSGEFRVNGVNGGNPIWGWMQFELLDFTGSSVSVVSFTYDDSASDTTAFALPEGGFVPTTIPEPSSLILLLAAVPFAWRRKRSPFRGCD